jgi:hypothetical protein
MFPECRKCEKRFIAAPAEPGSSHHGGAEDVDVRALEQEIDRHFYALYGLTPEEIKIVEDAGK